MSSARRVGAADSRVRARLIDVASELIDSEGCAAVTTQRLADAVGLKRHIIHYYFRTVEEVFVAVIRREGEAARDRLEQLLATRNPLEVLWEFEHHSRSRRFDLLAKALQGSALRAEMKHFLEQLHALSVAALERYVERHQVRLPAAPAVVVTILIAVSQALAVEEMLGADAGHVETASAVEKWLRSLEH